jgi:hypothetical protein
MDDLEVQILLFGEDEALDNITIGMVKEDNIECCICLNYHWGVKLPNCNHFICPKCYYKLFNGYISEDFYSKKNEPKYPEKPIYPYQNKDKNKEIFYSITQDDTYLEWFLDDNQDLYNSVKLNTEFVEDLDIHLKYWFENNEIIKQWENNFIQYEKDLKKYNIDIEEYNELYAKLYAEEKENNSQRRCPLCRL